MVSVAVWLLPDPLYSLRLVLGLLSLLPIASGSSLKPDVIHKSYIPEIRRHSATVSHDQIFQALTPLFVLQATKSWMRAWDRG